MWDDEEKGIEAKTRWWHSLDWKNFGKKQKKKIGLV